MLDGHYRAVFMTPEMYFGVGSMSKKVQKLWSMDKWKTRLFCIMVDELHCMERWGMMQSGKEAFWPEYSLLGQLQSQVPQVPIIGLTAMLTDDHEAKVKRSLFQYKDGKPLKIIKVDDMHDNLSFEVHISRASITAETWHLCWMIIPRRRHWSTLTQLWFSEASRMSW